MAQLTLYIPDDLATELKKKARKQRVSLSRYAATVLGQTGNRSAWPRGYFEKTCGFLTEPMQPPPDPAPEPFEPARNSRR